MRTRPPAVPTNQSWKNYVPQTAATPNGDSAQLAEEAVHGEAE